MYQVVLLQMSQLGKGFGAKSAAERPFTTVSSQVNFQVRQLAKDLETSFALVLNLSVFLLQWKGQGFVSPSIGTAFLLLVLHWGGWELLLGLLGAKKQSLLQGLLWKGWLGSMFKVTVLDDRWSVGKESGYHRRQKDLVVIVAVVRRKLGDRHSLGMFDPVALGLVVHSTLVD